MRKQVLSGLLLAGFVHAQDPAVPTTPAAIPATTPPATAAPAIAPPATMPSTTPAAAESVPVGMNQITGTVSSVDSDAGMLRLTVEGGFNVEFSLDYQTQISDHGQPIKAEELEYGDRVAVRYTGKQLRAGQILRLQNGRSTIPAPPPESAPPESAPPPPPLP